MASRRTKRERRRAVAVAAAVLLSAAAVRALPSGDVNCDGLVDENDLLVLTGALFDGAGDKCGAADSGGDGGVSAADCVSLVQMLAVSAPPTTGPIVTHVGLAAANGQLLRPIGETGGLPVFFRSSGAGFTIVVEGRAGPSGVKPAERTFNPLTDDPAERPAMQLESRNPLGEGSPTVCDGGVPGVNPPDFGPGREITDALNDMACHASVSTAAHSGCTVDAFDSPAFANRTTELQFCIPVSGNLALPTGDTLLAVRLVDLAGNPGLLGRIVVRVGSGPHPGTFTPTHSPTSATPAAVRTPTPTRTPTRASVPTATRTRTATPTPSAPSTPTPSVATPTATGISTAPSTDSPQPSPTRTPTPTSTRTRTATQAPTTPPGGVPTATPSRTPTRTPTRSPTGTATLAASATPTDTPTAAAAAGPRVTFIGIVNSADELVPRTGEMPDGVPIYARTTGRSFSLVIEAAPGSNGLPVGCLAASGAAHPDCATFPGESPLPDLQVVVTQALGNGSTDVCDATGAGAGGVPAVDPPTFDELPEVVDAIKDLGCRFVDGSGAPVGRGAIESCVSFAFEDSRFVRDESTIQFCAPITRAIEFPRGDTLVTARLRDVAGNVGPVGRMWVRVGAP